MRTSIIVASLFLCCSVNCAYAQQFPLKNQRKFEMGIGINFLGPVPQMKKLMGEYNFESTYNKKNYTNTSFGFTFQASYSQILGPRGHLGMMFNYSYLRVLWSNHPGSYEFRSLYLYLRLSNFSFVPFYKFSLSKNWELQLGPALLFNSVKQISKSGGGFEIKTTKPSVGLLAGLNLNLWDRGATYGKINTHYTLTYRNKIGPYPPSTVINQPFIPESEIRFGHMTIVFILGLKL